MVRKSTKPADIENQDVSPEVAEAAAQIQQTNSAIISAAKDNHDIAAAVINQRIGRRSAYEMVSKLLTVADLVDLQNIKDSKAYKGFNTLIDGKLLTVSTWDEYCEHVEKRSRQTIDNELLNLNALGPELFESMRTVGIGPGTMRAIRQLPEDKQELIQQAVATANKDDLAEFIEQMIIKGSQEKEALQKKLQNAQDDIAAKDDVAASNAKRIDELQKKAFLIKKMPVDEQAKTMRTEIAGLVTEIDHDLRTNLWDALEKLRESNGDDFNDFCQLQLQELQNALDLLKQQFATGEAWMK